MIDEGVGLPFITLFQFPFSIFKTWYYQDLRLKQEYFPGVAMWVWFSGAPKRAPAICWDYQPRGPGSTVDPPVPSTSVALPPGGAREQVDPVRSPLCRSLEYRLLHAAVSESTASAPFHHLNICRNPLCCLLVSIVSFCYLWGFRLFKFFWLNLLG